MEKQTKNKKKRVKRCNKPVHSDVDKIVGSRYLNNKLEYEVK